MPKDGCFKFDGSWDEFKHHGFEQENENLREID